MSLTSLSFYAILDGNALRFFGRNFNLAFLEAQNIDPLFSKWFFVVIIAVWTIPDVLMLYGINKKKPGFLIPWLVMYMIPLVVSLAQ